MGLFSIMELNWPCPHMLSLSERKSYEFGEIWRWVNVERIIYTFLFRQGFLQAVNFFFFFFVATHFCLFQLFLPSHFCFLRWHIFAWCYINFTLSFFLLVFLLYCTFLYCTSVFACFKMQLTAYRPICTELLVQACLFLCSPDHKYVSIWKCSFFPPAMYLKIIWYIKIYIGIACFIDIMFLLKKKKQDRS